MTHHFQRVELLGDEALEELEALAKPPNLEETLRQGWPKSTRHFFLEITQELWTSSRK